MTVLASAVLHTAGCADLVFARNKLAMLVCMVQSNLPCRQPAGINLLHWILEDNPEKAVSQTEIYAY